MAREYFEDKICKECRKPFPPLMKQHEYCSECYKNLFGKRRKCENCGKELTEGEIKAGWEYCSKCGPGGRFAK